MAEKDEKKNLLDATPPAGPKKSYWRNISPTDQVLRAKDSNHVTVPAGSLLLEDLVDVKELEKTPSFIRFKGDSSSLQRIDRTLGF